MKIINKLQYILLYLISVLIIGATTIITGDVGLNLFKQPSFYINQLLVDAAILCVTLATVYAYVDRFKETCEEYIENIKYISEFAKGKSNIPSIFSRFLESLNEKRKLRQYEHNIKRALFKLENKRLFILFGPRKYKEKDFYIWNHGTLDEKMNNEYCKKRITLEDKLTKEFIDRNFDYMVIKYDKVTTEVVLGGFYKDKDNNKANDFITKSPEGEVVSYKLPRLLLSFGVMFILSSLVFGEADFSVNALIMVGIKLVTLIWNTYTAIRYAKEFSNTVTLKDTRFRKGIILEYEKWLNQEAAKVAEKDKAEVKAKETKHEPGTQLVVVDK